MDILQELGQRVQRAVADVLGVDIEPPPLDIVPPGRPGDVVFNAFRLAGKAKKKPDDVTAALADALAGAPGVAEAHAVKGFLNITLDRGALMRSAVEDARRPDGRFGNARPGAGEHVLVEFSAPNTNKPQHLGHVRNNLLGVAVCNLLEATGQRVTRVNLVNDRGVHICKSMLAYLKWGEGREPADAGRKGDHFVGDFYVRFSAEARAQARETLESAEPGTTEELGRLAALPAPSPDDKQRLAQLRERLEEAENKAPITRGARELLRRWEAGDPDTVALWKRMNSWVLEGFEETYRMLGVRFDVTYYESETWKRGKDIALTGLESGVFRREENGAVAVDLEDDGLGKKVLLRGDGTSLYITQDLATTAIKYEEFRPDWMAWVVGDEQRHHFRVLFKILERLGHSWAARCRHLAYGMIALPRGMGKMKSREGRAVDADEFIAEVTALATDAVAERFPELSPEEAGKRARVIALAAVKFMILRVAAESRMVFNPEESISFTGATGPSLLYSYARVQSIKRGTPEPNDAPPAYERLGADHERALGLLLLQRSRVLSSAAQSCNPAVLAGYLFELSQAFASFYEHCHIKRCEDTGLRRARLLLSDAVARTLRSGLALLGIDVLEEM